MKSLIGSVIIAIVCILVESGSFAFEPVFRAGVKIEANGLALDIGRYSVPNVCDWNNDGKKDLLIGQFLEGKVRLYLNHGTDSSPVFTTFTFLEADGEDISVGGY